jgi:hypothetical protein
MECHNDFTRRKKKDQWTSVRSAVPYASVVNNVHSSILFDWCVEMDLDDIPLTVGVLRKKSM